MTDRVTYLEVPGKIWMNAWFDKLIVLDEEELSGFASYYGSYSYYVDWEYEFTESLLRRKLRTVWRRGKYWTFENANPFLALRTDHKMVKRYYNNKRLVAQIHEIQSKGDVKWRIFLKPRSVRLLDFRSYNRFCDYCGKCSCEGPVYRRRKDTKKIVTRVCYDEDLYEDICKSCLNEEYHWRLR